MTITVGLSEQVALNGATFYAPSATIGSSAAALAALSTVNSKLASLATTQAEIGSNLSRLESESLALSTLKDNLASARSRIVDVDVAEESANFAKQQILVQSGTAMLAQANILPQAALRLIN
jgi:flagellin